MKKIILTLIFLLSILGIKSQGQDAYMVNEKVKSFRLDGTRQNMVNATVYFGIDTLTSPTCEGIGGYAAVFLGVFYYTPIWATWDQQAYIMYNDSLSFFGHMSYNPNDRDLVWKADKPNYSTTSQANALYKPIAYQPTLTLNTNTLSAGGNSIVIPVQVSQTTYTVSRALMTTATNVSFTPSATKDAYVDYDVDITTAVALLSASQSSTVFLEYYNGSAWILQDQARNTQNLAVAITVGLTTIQTVKVTGWIPAGSPVRIRTTGTGSCAYFFGKERY